MSSPGKPTPSMSPLKKGPSESQIFHAKVGREIARKRFQYLRLRENSHSLPNIRFDQPGQSNNNSKRNRLKGTMFSTDASKDLHYAPHLSSIGLENSRFPSTLLGDNEVGKLVFMDDSVSSFTGKVSLKSTDTRIVDSIVAKMSRESPLELPDVVTNTLAEQSKEALSNGIDISKNNIFEKYVLSKDVAQMEPKPYQVHSKMMGWKLTTQMRKREMFNAIADATRYSTTLQTESSVYDTTELLENIEVRKKLQNRSVEAWEKTMSRMVKARCAKPKYMAEIALQSMNATQNTLSTFYVDRMNIISSAKKQSRGNVDYDTDIRQTLSRNGIDVDIEKITRRAFDLNVEEGVVFTVFFLFFLKSKL